MPEPDRDNLVAGRDVNRQCYSVMPMGTSHLSVHKQTSTEMCKLYELALALRRRMTQFFYWPCMDPPRHVLHWQCFRKLKHGHQPKEMQREWNTSDPHQWWYSDLPSDRWFKIPTDQGACKWKIHANILSLEDVARLEKVRVTMDSKKERSILVHLSSGLTYVFWEGEGGLYSSDTVNPYNW